MKRKSQLECPNDIAKHGPCDGLHEEWIGHVRECEGELAHLGVLPFAAREVAHEVRQETEQEHQDYKRHREILQRYSRMVADEEPCGRNTEDEFDDEECHGAYETKADSRGEIALILEEHSASRIIARMVGRDKSAYIAIIDLALCPPDGHRFGFAQEQTPFARFCQNIDRHEQKNGNKSKPQTHTATTKSVEKRRIIVKNDETIRQISIRRKDEQRIENTEIWSVRFHLRVQRY